MTKEEEDKSNPSTSPSSFQVTSPNLHNNINNNNNKSEESESISKDSERQENENTNENESEKSPLDNAPKFVLLPPLPPKTNGMFPTKEQLDDLQKRLHYYYSQYYSYYYILLVRQSYKEYFPTNSLPEVLAHLPGTDEAENEANSNLETEENPSVELSSYYANLHSHYNLTTEQYYRKWYYEQLEWIKYQHEQQLQFATLASDPNDEFGGSSDYSAAAFFNKKTNRFQKVENHWESKGLPTDREGRQLSAFFDVEAYQQSRAIEKKPNKPKKQSAKYWKKVKEEKKRKKAILQLNM